jgi:hypothetical protein
MNQTQADPPLVSAIIPTYNGGAFLADAIDSVLTQSYPAIECIVVDDGSTDDTPAIIAAFEGRIRRTRQANQGPARARNQGARMARGEFIAFLDDDDVWRPAKVERQVSKLAQRPAAAVVYTAVEVVDAEGTTLAIIPAPSREFAFRNTLLMQWPHLALEQGALIRRSAFTEVGASTSGSARVTPATWPVGSLCATRSNHWTSRSSPTVSTLTSCTTISQGSNGTCASSIARSWPRTRGTARSCGERVTTSMRVSRTGTAVSSIVPIARCGMPRELAWSAPRTRSGG